MCFVFNHYEKIWLEIYIIGIVITVSLCILRTMWYEKYNFPFQRDDAQTALISNNMNYDSALGEFIFLFFPHNVIFLMI